MLCWIRAVHHKPSAQPRAESSSPTPKPCTSGRRLSSPRHSPHAWHSQRDRDTSCSLAWTRWRTCRPPVLLSTDAHLRSNQPRSAPLVKLLSRELRGTAAWCTPEEVHCPFCEPRLPQIRFSVNITTNWEF